MGSSNDARARVIICNLVETPQNAYQYFELLLTEIPKHMNDTVLSFINKLTSWSPQVQDKYPSRYKNS